MSNRTEEADALNCFLTAFNRIDASIRSRTGLEIGKGDFCFVLHAFNRSVSFSHSDFRFLLSIAELRNVIVHETKDSSYDLAIPTKKVVEHLERIARELEAPEKLEARFATGSVTCLLPTQTLSELMKMIRKHEFSQFPVIENDRIAGLLTENGISRWLAASVCEESMVEFNDATVADVIGHEEPRENMLLRSRFSYLDDVRKTFSNNVRLEAVVVTQSGQENEAPLGIVTRYDL